MSVAHHHRDLRVGGRGLVEWWDFMRRERQVLRRLPEDGAGWVMWFLDASLGR